MYVYMYILLNSINFYLYLCNLTYSSTAFSYSSFSNIYDKNIRLDLYHGAFTGGRFLRPEKHIIDSLLHFILINFLSYIAFLTLYYFLSILSPNMPSA